MVVVSCGSFACRALLLNTPKVLVTPASAPPVTLLCCVYLKSARLVPTAAIVTAAIAATDRNLTMSPDSQRLSSFDVCHPEAPFFGAEGPLHLPTPPQAWRFTHSIHFQSPPTAPPAPPRHSQHKPAAPPSRQPHTPHSCP